MILILTESSDTHADRVAEKLRQRSADFVRFDPADFPANSEVSLSFGSDGQSSFRLSHESENVDLSRLTAVWFRRPGSPTPHKKITDQGVRNYVEDECTVFMRDAWGLTDCLWLPAPAPVIRRAELKAFQLKVAASLGFELPPTLFTNSPDDFVDFYNKHNGNIVSKLAGSSFHKFNGTRFNRYTQVVSKRDVAHARSIRYSPIIFQAYVPKRVELRVTVVGKKVFAAEIHSQETNHTKHDWRRYDRYQTPYFPHDLPLPLQNLCIRLVEQLGLCYGAIDMVLTPEGRYVFLEINPNGQYLWIEQVTGLPISDAICDLLVEGAVKNERDHQPVQEGALRG